MPHRGILGWIASSMVVAAAAAGGDGPPCYTVQELPPLDGNESAAYGLNDAGQVVGSAQTDDPLTRAVRWDDGVTVDLGVGSGATSIAFDVNASGQIAGLVNVDVSGVTVNRGFRWTGGVTEILEPLPLDSAAIGRAIADDGRVAGTSIEFDLLRAVFWSGTQAQDLGTIDGPQADAWGMNDLGDIVGWSNNVATGFFGRRAFRGGGGRPEDLGTLGGFFAWAHDVSTFGQVVGEAGLATGEIHATLWHAGGIQDLGVLATGDWSRAQAISDAGIVVGWSRLQPNDATTHAFLWDHGVMHDLNDLVVNGAGWVLADAQDINASGQVAGTGTRNGGLRGFLLTPVTTAPCPADVTGDGIVGVDDLIGVITAWGPCPGCVEDVSGDGVVGVDDLNAVIVGWGGCGSG